MTAVEGLHYALNLPASVVITGCDSMQVLEQALSAARTFRPMSDQTASLLARTAEPYVWHRYPGSLYDRIGGVPEEEL